jgi:hypothetical protein
MREVSIKQERHDYRLEVAIHNVGESVLRNYHLDVEMPTVVLVDLGGAVPERSNGEMTFFRAAWQASADDVFPDDRRISLTVPYFMDSRLYRDRGGLLDRPISATLFCAGRRLVRVERRFSDFQRF